MHFSEIITLHIGKERHTLLCILKLITNIDDYLSKMRGNPNFLFEFHQHLLRSAFPPNSYNHAKIPLN